MNLVKTSILSFIATATKVIAGLVINKAFSVFIGPAGLALIGQFQNFSQLAMTVAQAGIKNGVTKFIAEYGKEHHRIPILFSTAAKISLISSFATGLGIVIFSNYASLHILKSIEYSYIFVIFGFTIILFVINNLLLSILNGLKEIKAWVNINIIQSIYSLIFTTLLIIFFGMEGALIALVTNQSIILLIILWMLRRHVLIKVSNFLGPFDIVEAKKLGGYALMTFTSATIVPISHIIIRNYIGENLSWEEAGYWQAIWYISSTYLLLVTTPLTIYYLPRLSEITDKAELRKELLHGYSIIMPIIIIASLIIFLFKDFIIAILFAEDFTPVRDLFLWQLIGDIIKLASWLIAYLMLAKSMVKVFITTEIIFSLLFILLTFKFIELYGLVGITYSYTLNYVIYFFVILYLTRSEWRGI